jgi:WD40 repeat protein
MKTLLFLVMLVILAGCNVFSSTTATLPVESQTPLSQPTVSLLPSSTQTPAQPTASSLPTSTQTPEPPTPEPSLRTNGPYFGYFRQVPGFDTLQFVLMDADGVGRKVFDLPDEITDTAPIRVQYISPDGKSLAFFTGYAGDPYREAKQTTFDLTLNLLNLDTGETQIITPLLSKNYPDNFTKAINEFNDPLLRPEELQAVFLAGIMQALAWSPDGRYLAFAGQMDGLSSDAYLYDMVTKKIRRLPSDNEELQWVNWSPDGKWILYGSRVSNAQMTDYSIYGFAMDNSTVRDFGYAYSSDWLNSHEFLEYRFCIERCQLRLVDVETGKVTEIWEGYFGGYEVDPTGTWVVVDAISSTVPPGEEEPEFVYGAPQLINLKSLEKIQMPDPFSNPTAFYLPDMFLHAKDGLVVPLPNSGIFASPDAKYWVDFINHYVKIYTYDSTLVKEISIPLQNTEDEWPNDIQWSPDSSYLFLMYGRFKQTLYVVNISNEDVNPVDSPVGYGRWFNVNP